MPVCLKVEEAAREGAELILLPEDGIHGYGFTRYKVKITGQQVSLQGNHPRLPGTSSGRGREPLSAPRADGACWRGIGGLVPKILRPGSPHCIHYEAEQNSLLIFCKR